MSHFIARPRENFIKIHFPIRENLEPVALLQDKIRTAGTEHSLACSVRAIQIEGRAGLLSQVTYALERSHSFTGKDALNYAEVINHLLVHSQVFVVQDIDGDRCYSLRMETLLSAPYNRRRITQFVENIAQDISVLTQYCKSKIQEDSENKVAETSCQILPLAAKLLSADRLANR